MKDSLGALLAVLLSPILIPLAVIIVIAWLLASAAIVFGISVLWRTRGVSFLIVYSDSAQWKRYFEEEVIPAFGPRARVINLSTDGGQKRWWHLDWRAYRHCAGYRDRFPVILRFYLLGPWKVIRFYEAFMAAKKGKTSALEESKALAQAWMARN